MHRACAFNTDLSVCVNQSMFHCRGCCYSLWFIGCDAGGSSLLHLSVCQQLAVIPTRQSVFSYELQEVCSFLREVPGQWKHRAWRRPWCRQVSLVGDNCPPSLWKHLWCVHKHLHVHEHTLAPLNPIHFHIVNFHIVIILIIYRP